MEMHEYLRPGDRSMIRDEYRQLFPTRPDRAYLQSLRQLSSDVAGFVQELSSLPGWEDAVFVVTSDHGEGLHDHPDVAFAEAHGWVLYESQLMVPLIVYRAQWPQKQNLAGLFLTCFTGCNHQVKHPGGVRQGYAVAICITNG